MENYFDRADVVADRLSDPGLLDEAFFSDLRFLIEAYREARALNNGTLERIREIRELRDERDEAVRQLSKLQREVRRG